MSIPCEAGCGRRFNVIGSMHKHLLSYTKCGGYLDGKMRDLGLFEDENDLLSKFQGEDDSDVEWDDDQAQEVPYEPFIFEPLNPNTNEFHFIPTVPEDVGNDSSQGAVPGPGPSTASNSILRQAAVQRQRLLDIQEDPSTVLWTEGAGRVLCKVTPPSYGPQDIKDAEGDIKMAEGDRTFFPFSSELDWRVAQWAIKDGPGQNAFDRLLEIPGVSYL